MRKLLLFLFFVPLLTAGEFFYMNGGKRIELTPVPEKNGAMLREVPKTLRFKDPKGREIAIENRLIVKFRSVENLDDYLNIYNLHVVKKFSFGNMYLLEAPTPKAAMDAANALCEMPDVEFAQPDIMRKRMLR